MLVCRCGKKIQRLSYSGEVGSFPSLTNCVIYQTIMVSLVSYIPRNSREAAVVSFSPARINTNINNSECLILQCCCESHHVRDHASTSIRRNYVHPSDRVFLKRRERLSPNPQHKRSTLHRDSPIELESKTNRAGVENHTINSLTDSLYCMPSEGPRGALPQPPRRMSPHPRGIRGRTRTLGCAGVRPAPPPGRYSPKGGSARCWPISGRLGALPGIDWIVCWVREGM